MKLSWNFERKSKAEQASPSSAFDINYYTFT